MKIQIDLAFPEFDYSTKKIIKRMQHFFRSEEVIWNDALKILNLKNCPNDNLAARWRRQGSFVSEKFGGCVRQKKIKWKTRHVSRHLILVAYLIKSYGEFHRFRKRSKMIIFQSILTTFEASSIFWGSWGSIKITLKFKIKSLKAN